MESFSGDTEESTEDVPGRRKSKLRSLRSRLFRKSKKSGGEEKSKLSQSASDISAGKGLGSDEDLVCSQAMMGSRALSHDSIFLAGQVLTDDEASRGSSQQNVHSKIKALQTKLLQQKLHFGPPPAVLPIKHLEEPSSQSEESLDRSPPDSPGGDVPSYGALSKTTSQPASCPFGPIPRSVPTKSLPPTPSHFFPSLGPTASASAVEAPLDFSSPAQFSPCLDSSAARHRMSIKPRNQRASSKKKLTVTQSLSLSQTLNNVDNFGSVEEPERQQRVQEEEKTIIAPHLPFRPAEAAPVPLEEAKVPLEVGKVPLEMGKVPLEVAKVPLEMGKVPFEVAKVPSEVGKVSFEVGKLPSEVTKVPLEVGQVQSEVRKLPSEVGKVQSEVGKLPLEVGKLPSEVGKHPFEVTKVPLQVGKVSLEVAKLPLEVGKVPLEVGKLPSEVGKLPSEVGKLPSEVGKHPSDVTPVSSEVSAVKSEAASKPSSSSSPHQDQTLPWTVPPVLRVKPYRRVDAASSRRPHSSYMESELKERREADFEIQLMSQDRRSVLNKAAGPEGPSSNFSPVAAFRSSCLLQHVKVEGDGSRGIRRPASGSFHLSITAARNRDGERPRSGSFVEVLDQNKTTGGNEEKENRSFQPRGGGRPRPEEPTDQVLSWDRSIKKVEPAPKGAVEEVESSQEEVEEVEEVEEAVEAKEVQEEDDGKTAFGVKLRSTSLSFRLRPNSTLNPNAAPSDDPRIKPHQQEIRSTVSHTYDKLPSNTPSAPTSLGEPRPRDPTPSGLSPPVKHSAAFTSHPPINPSDPRGAKTAPLEAHPAPLEPHPAPQSAGSEVSWMSLAMEKTRSLQQLFTSRFPRDFTAARPQQAPPANPAETQTQTVRILEGAAHLEAANQPPAEAAFSTSQAQTVKAAPVTPVAFKETNKEEPNAAQSHPVFPPQPTSWMTSPPAPVPVQTEPTPPFSPQSPAVQPLLPPGQQQPWSSRGPSIPRSGASPPSVHASGREEEEAAGKKEAPSLSVRRAVWSGSVSDRAVFLEKRAEWSSSPGNKGVELRKPQSDVQTSGEPPASIKISPLLKDVIPEGRPGLKLAESSPTKVLERPLEDKWPRKNVVASSLRSSPPTLPSDSGQPSWMELAKRKSMAWSDKSMD